MLHHRDPFDSILIATAKHEKLYFGLEAVREGTVRRRPDWRFVELFRQIR
jgi:hypothetical protein